MAQKQGQPIALSSLPAALEKAVELAKQNHITDRQIFCGIYLREAEAANAATLAAEIAHEIGGPQAQPVVTEAGAGAALEAKTAAPAALPHGKIIGLRFEPKIKQ